MAVPAGPTEVRYVGNGVSTVFTIPFLLILPTDLDVFINGVEQTSGYLITGAGNPTSTITFTAAPALDADVYLALNVPFERLNDYQENGDFLSSTVNRDFDRIWQALKQLFRGATRALTLGATDVDGSGWYRAKGNGIRDLADPIAERDGVNLRSMRAMIEQALAGVVGGAGWFLQIGVGAVARTFQSKMRDVVSVKDFGAVGDGVADDTAAFFNAGPGAYVPNGLYLVDPAVVDARRYHGPGLLLVAGQLTALNNPLVDGQNAQIFGGSPKFGWNAPGGNTEIYPGAGNATQGLTIIRHEGVDKLFISQRVSGASWGTDEMIRITELRWTGDGTDMVPIQFTEPLSAGHGSDLTAFIENGELYFITTARNDGGAGGGASLGGKGFSKIRWRGAATTQADVQVFKVFGDKDDGSLLPWPQRASVCATDDGKFVIIVATSNVGTGRFFFVYNRKQVEAAGPDARTVTPLVGPVPFERSPGELGATLQGMTSDGVHLYTVWGGGAVTSAKSIQIYDMSGRLRRTIPYTGPSVLYTMNELWGLGAKGIPVSFEPEGICLHGGELLTLAVDAWKNPNVVTAYEGFNWANINTTATSGRYPWNRASWVKTKLPANTVFDVNAAYAAGAYSARDKRIMRIVVSTGAANERPISDASTDATTGTMKEYFSGTDIAYNAENGSFTIAKFIEALGTYKKFIELNYDNNFNIFSTQEGDNNSRWVTIKSAWDAAMYGMQLRSSGGQTAQGAWLDLHANDCPNTPSEAVLASGSSSVGVRLRNATITVLVATTEGLIYYGNQFIRATTDNAVALGRSINRFSVVWAGTGTINTSDARLKTAVEPFSMAHLRAGCRMADELGLYQWLEEIEKKGADVARLHAGTTVQRAIEIFREEGVDPLRLAAVCYDKWEAHDEVLEPAQYDDNKVLVQPEIVQHIPAGDRYSFRDHQLQYLLLASLAWRQREEIKAIHDRLDALEGGSNK